MRVKVSVSPLASGQEPCIAYMLGLLRDENDEIVVVVDRGHGMVLDAVHPSRVTILEPVDERDA